MLHLELYIELCILLCQDPSRKANFAVRNKNEEFPDEVFQNKGGSMRRKVLYEDYLRNRQIWGNSGLITWVHF